MLASQNQAQQNQYQNVCPNYSAGEGDCTVITGAFRAMLAGDTSPSIPTRVRRVVPPVNPEQHPDNGRTGIPERSARHRSTTLACGLSRSQMKWQVALLGSHGGTCAAILGMSRSSSSTISNGRADSVNIRCSCSITGNRAAIRPNHSRLRKQSTAEKCRQYATRRH